MINKMTRRFRKWNVVLVAAIALLSCTLMGFDAQQEKVYDNAGLLSVTERDELESLCVQTAQQTETDIAIVTINNNEGKSPRDYAEDAFMEYNLGYDKAHGDGVLLLIDMQSRKTWIATSGNAITYLSDSRLESINNAVTAKLKNNQYYAACKIFVEKVATDMKSLPNGSSTAKDQSLSQRLLDHWWLKILISLAVGGVVVAVMAHNARAQMTVGSQTYTRDHKFDVRDRRDIFINTTVVKHKIETNHNNGGSSTHTGSGGNTFGGGGGSF